MQASKHRRIPAPGVAFLVAALLVAVGCGGSADEARPKGAAPAASVAARRPAPDFALTDITGAPLRLADHRGKVVLLNFWATWCPPCVREIPDLVALREELGPDRVEVLGISLDTTGEDGVREFVRRHGVTYPVAVDTANVSASYGGVSGIPTTFVIDAEGRVVKTIVGPRSKSGFMQAVERASKG